MRARATVLAMVAAGGLAVGGCGDDGPDRLSREEFVTQGNAICAEGERRLDTLAEEAFAGFTEENPPTEEDFQKFVEESAIPELERQFDELDELAPPEDLEDELDAALEEARAAADRARDDPSLLAAEEDTTFDRANELIAEAGLDACAEEE